MKIFNKTYAVLVAVAFFSTTIGTAQISKAEIIATGLTCSMCSNAINKQLKSLPEVVNVEIDLNTNTFVVSLAEGNALTPAIFKQKVEKAGFFIGSLIVTVDAAAVAKSPYIIIKNSGKKTEKVEIQVLDKGFVTEKEFKKLVKSYKNIATYDSDNEDDFHVKILN